MDPDSANSSPRSRPDSSTCWDDHHSHPLPPKLRLMCSFGGHIIPRPHDRSLCYVGGDTRIVVLDRTSSLSQLHSRLSHSLLNGRPFTLKYQLPTEDLDSLISLATDEDLENMIDEYDRNSSAASPLKPSRLRLFLFPTKPETAASMGALLDDAKSETWFVDVLNGAGLLPRGLSDSAAIDNLLELNRGADLERQQPHNQNESSSKLQVASEISTGNNIAAQEAMLDSPPLVETSSSFGSSSSSPSMANLPPIRVRVEDYQTVGLDEQFSNVSIAPNAAPPPVPSPFVILPSPKAGGSGENLNRAVYDDDQKLEKSDHGNVAPTAGLRKPPLPLQPVQRKLVDIHNLPSPDSKHAGGYNLPSPDSVASDCSVTSAGSLSKNTIYQDAAAQLMNRENRVPTPVIDQKSSNNNNINVQEPHQLVDSAPVLVPPQQYQPAFHPAGPNTHYIQHPAAHVPMSSYYPMYQQQVAAAADPQYPMYLQLPPLTQAQPAAACYDSNRPVIPPLANNMATYKDPSLAAMYTSKAPEMAGNMYQTGTGAGAGAGLLVQFQQPYIGIAHQVTPPPPAQSSAAPPTYGYDQYSHHMQQDQVYYSAAAPQYQTMTPAAAVMLSTHQHPSPPADTSAAQ